MGSLPRVLDLELAVELQHLARREDRRMGVEHQVEQRRTAMARSGDVDHPHSTPLIRGACLAPQKKAAYRLGRARLPCDI